MSGFRIEGLDELQRKLSDLQKRAEEMHGDNEVPLEELLTPAFLRIHSEFGSVSEMLESAGISTVEDFKATSAAELDRFISEHTACTSWQELLNSAVEDWAKRQLGL